SGMPRFSRLSAVRRSSSTARMAFSPFENAWTQRAATKPASVSGHPSRTAARRSESGFVDAAGRGLAGAGAARAMPTRNATTRVIHILRSRVAQRLAHREASGAPRWHHAAEGSESDHQAEPEQGGGGREVEIERGLEEDLAARGLERPADRSGQDHATQ